MFQNCRYVVYLLVGRSLGNKFSCNIPPSSISYAHRHLHHSFHADTASLHAQKRKCCHHEQQACVRDIIGTKQPRSVFDPHHHILEHPL